MSAADVSGERCRPPPELWPSAALSDGGGTQPDARIGWVTALWPGPPAALARSPAHGPDPRREIPYGPGTPGRSARGAGDGIPRHRAQRRPRGTGRALPGPAAA